MTAEPKWWHGTPGTLKWAFARIRELEADLEHDRYACHVAAHARLEAEIERLQDLLFAERELRETIQRGYRRGGRESGNESGNVADGWYPSPNEPRPAAANPAARKEG